MSSVKEWARNDPGLNLPAKMEISFPICPKTYFPSIWIQIFPE
jgi:hypothetical protein